MCELEREITRILLESYDKELAEERDKKKYRGKGGRETSTKTVYGEVEYSRRVYRTKTELISHTFHEKREACIRKKYDANEIGQRILNGDGGSWIGEPYAPDVIFQLYRYHIYQEVLCKIQEKSLAGHPGASGRGKD